MCIYFWISHLSRFFFRQVIYVFLSRVTGRSFRISNSTTVQLMRRKLYTLNVYYELRLRVLYNNIFIYYTCIVKCSLRAPCLHKTVHVSGGTRNAGKKTKNKKKTKTKQSRLSSSSSAGVCRTTLRFTAKH